MELNLVLPWPPSVNHYKKVGAIVKTKNGKTYQKRVNTDATKTFYYLTYNTYRSSMPQGWAKQADSDTIEYEVWVSLHPPSKRRYDVDNRLKVLLDALVYAKAIKDDSQITKLIIEKKHVITHGKVVVTLKPKTVAIEQK